MKDRLNKLREANIDRKLLIISDGYDDRADKWNYSMTTWYSVSNEYIEAFEKLFEAEILTEDILTYLFLEDYDKVGKILEKELKTYE